MNDDKSRLALTLLINKYLIGTAGVDSLAPFSNRIISVAIRALAADPIDAIVGAYAITIERVKVEYLVLTARITVIIRAGGDLRGRFAVIAILG